MSEEHLDRMEDTRKNFGNKCSPASTRDLLTSTNQHICHAQPKREMGFYHLISTQLNRHIFIANQVVDHVTTD